MGKKSKKSSGEGDSGSKVFRKLKRQLVRMLIIGIVAFIVLGLYNPDLIDHPQAQKYFSQARNGVDHFLPHILGSADWLKDRAQDIPKEEIMARVLGAKVDEMPDEIVVEELVKDFTDQVKSLPASQVERIKYHICEEIIGYAPREQAGE